MVLVSSYAYANEIHTLKQSLLELVSAFLLKEPSLAHVGTSDEDERISFMRELVQRISKHDGEFVLKVALYLRHDLNIRRTSNLLTALCAREDKCVPYLECYMERIIVLPTDWLSIAEYAFFFDADQLHGGGASLPLPDKDPISAAGQSSSTRTKKKSRRGVSTERDTTSQQSHHGTELQSDSVLQRRQQTTADEGCHQGKQHIPAALRRALVSCFKKFSEFSLAKYNNERAERKRYKTKPASANEQNEPPSRHSFTIKQLIRMLHISEPAHAVCCILGKRYPSDEDAFRRMGLDAEGRAFDPSRSGQRMRLLTPVTWETQLASLGNKGSVWDGLVANNQLPFMAMLRNLRNIVTRHCAPQTHTQILDRLRSEEQVANSRQFPYRFFSAYNALDEAVRDVQTTQQQQQQQANQKRSRRQRKGRNEPRPCELPLPNLRQLDMLIDNYKRALSESVEIATRLNVVPMRGTSVVILSLSDSMLEPISAVGGGPIGSLQTKVQIASLLAVMMKYACEDCVIIASHMDRYVFFTPDKNYRHEPLLQCVTHLTELCTDLVYGQANADACMSGAFPYAFLDQIIEKRMSVESMMVVDEGHHTYSNMNVNAPSLGDLPVYLSRLRRNCNENLVYVGLSVTSSSSSNNDENPSARFTHRNDILLTGFNDSILRLVAERSNGGALAVVERADETYEVNRAAARLSQFCEGDRLRALNAILQAERAHQSTDANELPQSLQDSPAEETVSQGKAAPAPLPPPAAASRFSAVSLNGITECSSFEELKHMGGALAQHAQWSDAAESTAYRFLPPSEVYNPPVIGVKTDSAAPSVVVKHPTSFITLSHMRPSSEDVPSTNATFSGADAHAVVARPLSSFREFRFFISSTFLDMNNERNALTLDVFPRLRRWAAEQSLKVTILEVDLRWGITELATNENLSTSVCLNQVSRCSPFFIGIIGSRYGSCPSPIHIVADEDVDLGDYEWLGEIPPDMDGSISVTELEMRHGVYNAHRRVTRTESQGGNASVCPSALFFYREPGPLDESLPQDERREVYAPDTANSVKRIATLRQYLHGKGVPIVPYKASFTSQAGTGGAAGNSVMPSDALDPSLALTAGTLGGSTDLSVGSEVSSNFGAYRKRKLTSQDVLINTKDFAEKAFVALQNVIIQACGVGTGGELSDASGRYSVAATTANNSPAAAASPLPVISSPLSEAMSTVVASSSPTLQKKKPQYHADFYSRMYGDMRTFAESLRRLYVPPAGLIETLARFSLTGATPRVSAAQDDSPNASTNAWRLTKAEVSETAAAVEHLGLEEVVAMSTTNVVVLEGSDGDGKSSTLATLALHLIAESAASGSTFVVYYSAQATDGSLRSLALFLALSFIIRGGLHDEFQVSETETISGLLHVLPMMYAALKKRGVSAIVILDALERCAEPDELLRLMGTIAHPASAGELRYVIATGPGSAFSLALRARVPPACAVTVPPLHWPERAQLIRKHLASYGKQLQESMDLNELKELMRKRDACLPSYLTSAITYLRLFSSFDTLRDDIRRLPSSISQLYSEFFKEIEKRFEPNVCRLVLTTLYLRQDVGGIMEHSLYRLVPDVSAATRLITLLLGTCIASVRGRLFISSSFFASSIALTYLHLTSDTTAACENLLASELTFRPLVYTRDRSSIRSTVTAVVDSIRRSVASPHFPCVFDPCRYAPHELLGIIRTAVQARRFDAAVALASYLPFVENLLRDPGMLQRLMGMLSQLKHINPQTAKKIHPVVGFLQEHHHVLSVRPDLLCQCALNTPPSFTALSRYGTATIAALAESGDKEEEEEEAAEEASSLLFAATGDTLADHTWIRWINKAHHGGENRISVRSPSRSPILCMAVSTDTSLVAMGCMDCCLRIAPRLTAEHPIFSLKHAGAVTAVCFSPHRRNIIVSGCEKGILYVWSIEDGTLIQLGERHIRPISSIACHPTDDLVCTGGLDSQCMLWDILGGTSAACTTIECRGAQRVRGDHKQHRELSPSLRGRFPAASRVDRRRALLQPFDVQRHHRAPVSSVAFHSSGELLATGSWDGSVHLVNLTWVREDTGINTSNKKESPFEVQQFSIGVPVRTVSFSPSQVVLCTVGTFTGDVKLIDYAAGHVTDVMELRQQLAAPITALSFSEDGAIMAIGDERGGIILAYAGITGTLIGAFNGHRHAVTGLHFVTHEDGSRGLVSSGVDHTVQSWAVRDNSRQVVPHAHSAAVTAIAVASDGRRYVSGCADGTALVFQRAASNRQQSTTALFEPFFTLSHNGCRVSTLQFGLDDTRILAGVAFGSIYVWSAVPGLNRREGRLLQCVRVPTAGGLYPVIAVECRSLPQDGSRGPAATEGLVTAVCSSGDTAIFHVYHDAVYMKQAFQRGEDSTASHSPYFTHGDNDAFEGSGTLPSMSMVTDDGCGSPHRWGHHAGPLVAMRESVDFTVQRQRLSWISIANNSTCLNTPLRPRAEVLPGGYEPQVAGEELIGMIPVAFSCGDEAVSSPECESVHTAPADKSASSSLSTQHKNMTSSPVESTTSSPSSHSRCSSSMSQPSTKSSTMLSAKEVGGNLFQVLDSHDTRLPAQPTSHRGDHLSILVGQQRLFLGSHRDSEATEIAIVKHSALQFGEETFETDFALGEDEAFIASSQAAYAKEGSTVCMFALATNSGRVLLFKATNGSKNHLVGASHSPRSPGLASDKLHVKLIHRLSVKTTPVGNEGSVVMIDSLDVVVDSQGVCLVLGCRDGSTRLLSAEYAYASSPSEHKDTLAFKEVALLYGTSSLTALRAHASPADTLTWMAGDSQGNLYHLQLETMADVVQRCQEDSQQTRHVRGSVYSLSRQRVLECLSSTTQKQAKASTTGSLDPTTLGDGGWAWSSMNPMDWLTTRVEMDRPLASQLATSCAAAAPADVLPPLPVSLPSLTASSTAWRDDAMATQPLVSLPQMKDMYHSAGSILRNGVDGVANGGMDSLLKMNENDTNQSRMPAVLPSYAFERKGEDPAASGAPVVVSACAPAAAMVNDEGASKTKPDSRGFFSVILQTVPPGLAFDEKRAWLLHQQRTLKEAMRVQHYNEDARRALECYSRKVKQ